MIKKIISKKGSHVGVVISFVVFVTFLVFLYTIIQPATVREKDKSYILDYITLNLIGDSTGNITSLIIQIEGPIPKTCVQLQNVPEETIPGDMWHNLVFRNPTGENLDYYLKQNKIYIYCGLNFDGIINTYYSEDTIGQENDALSKDCYPHENTFGYIKTFSEVFETKMYELNESYYTDYEALKIALGIPFGTEFNFYIYNSDRSEIIISAKIQEPPTDRSVFVQETPIQYIDENGNKMFGFLKVEIW